jgi:flagellar protein FliJ
MAGFSLAALLRLKQLREDQAANEMGHARSRASELASQRHQLIDRLSDHGHDARDVRGIAAISAARASTSMMLTELEALRITLERSVETAEAAHRAARRDTRMLEKLEERSAEADRVEELRVEQLALDELAARARARFQARANDAEGTDS